VPDDLNLMEESLVAMADAGLDIRHGLFDRFFEAFPDRLASFYNLEHSGQRMTDETLQMMVGLAGGETWVEPLVAELTFTHRSYGHLPDAEYEAFIAMTVDAVAQAATSVWTPAHEAAWRLYADRLYAMILHHRTEWTRIMPGAVTAS
jgi:hypothetical protein